MQRIGSREPGRHGGPLGGGVGYILFKSARGTNGAGDLGSGVAGLQDGVEREGSDNRGAASGQGSGRLGLLRKARSAKGRLKSRPAGPPTKPLGSIPHISGRAGAVAATGNEGKAATRNGTPGKKPFQRVRTHVHCFCFRFFTFVASNPWSNAEGGKLGSTAPRGRTADRFCSAGMVLGPGVR